MRKKTVIKTLAIVAVVSAGLYFALTSTNDKNELQSEASDKTNQIPAKPQAPEISADFPFKSHFVNVLGSQMHYVEEGEGDPILFIHGNPTSSYLWRNIIPFVSPHGRAIAIDLIGMGKSDKPDIDYIYADHIQYVEGFIEVLDLKNITLVIHDWGSALGFDYASRHPDNIKGIVFMESIVPPAFPASYEKMPPFFANFFQTLRDPEKGPEMVINQNTFVEDILPNMVTSRDLTEVEMNAYRAPYLEPESRKPLLVWPNQVPIDGEPADVVDVVNAYNEWLFSTDIPKLHIYASPGALNPPELVDFLKQHLKNYETAYIGLGTHFIQEDQPEAIGRAISDWYRREFETS
ncbi:MAG: haloalkane dehalogenase [Proteobacteria bacterium]|nr:haloalkane dehalogenase [Pseudomonadota bacterium]